MPGPPKKTDEEKRRSGNRNNHKEKTLNVFLKVQEPKKATWLDKDAKDHWNEIVPLLMQYGLCTLLDGPALSAMCSQYSQAIKAEKVLNTKGKSGGPTFLSPNGHICQRPQVKIAKDAWSAYYQYAEKFGMTPAARARMRIPMPKPPGPSGPNQTKNKVSSFFGSSV